MIPRWDQIRTQEVREVCLAYHYFYYITGQKDRVYRRCGCSEQTGRWPDNFVYEDGLQIPAICEVHEWRYKRDQLQNAITSAGLSMPIPAVFSGGGSHTHKNYDYRKHPFYLDQPFIESFSGGSQTAARIAMHLVANHQEEGYGSVEHVVFYVHQSQMINMMYEQREKQAEEILLWAPALVLWQNPDARNGSRIEALVRSRQYGYAFIVK